MDIINFLRLLQLLTLLGIPVSYVWIFYGEEIRQALHWHKWDTHTNAGRYGLGVMERMDYCNGCGKIRWVRSGM